VKFTILRFTNYDMTKEELKERFQQYAINVAFLVLKLPYNVVNKNYSDQLNRAASGTANYRSSLRAKSNADFLNKFKIVEKELNESLFFFDLIEIVNPSFKEQMSPIYAEGNELLSIIVASLNTLTKKTKKSKS